MAEKAHVSFQLLESVKEKGFHKYIERAQKNQIKIPVSDVIKFPTEVARYLQKLKKSSTSFGGKTGRKVITFH